MRVLHICHDYWPAVGGSELLLKEVSERLVRLGDEVSVLTSNALSAEAFVNPALPLVSPGEELIGGVQVKRFGVFRRFRRPLDLLMQATWRLRLPLNDLVRTFWNGPTCPRMIHEIARAKPDLVTATAFPFQTMYYPFVARLFHPFPIVLIPCFHPTDAWSFDRPIMEKALKAADAVIALTDYERDHLLSMGVPGNRVHVLGVGTDPESFAGIDPSAFRKEHGIGTADPVIAFVGRMEREKGAGTLLDAMPRVWREAPSARLVFAGPTTHYSPAIAAKIAALSPQEQQKIMLLGLITEAEKRELLATCDLLSLPSRVESFGIVYLEAWACGKPVIGCRTGAVSSVIDDEWDGLLVTYGDADELAAAITRLLSDDAMRRAMGEKGKAKVADRYTWDRIAGSMRGLYRQLIDARRGATSVPSQKFVDYVSTRYDPLPTPLPLGEGLGEGAAGAKTPSPSPSPPHRGEDKGDTKRAPHPLLSPAGGEDKGEGAAVRRAQQSEARPRPKVSVVIVSYNSRGDLPECLASLQQSTFSDTEILVADNGSTDGSVEFIRKACPFVKVIELGTNLGFAEANNRAMRVARGEYLFLLNPDTRVDRRCLEELVRTLEADQGIGVVAAKMKLYFEPDVLNSAGIAANRILYGWDRGAFELDRGQYDEQAEVIAGCGGALMVRRSLAERIGGLDAAFFMYYEDLDFGIRTWMSGDRVVFIPGAVVYHKYKAATRPALYNEYYDHRNRIRTMLKNFSLSTLAWMLPASLKLTVTTVAKYLTLGRFRDAGYQLWAILWNLAVLPGTLKERRRVQRLRAVPDARILGLLAEGMGYPTLGSAVPTPETAYGQTVVAGQLDPFVEMGNNDHRQLGLGWHPREQWGDRVARWTSGYGIAFVANPDADRAEKRVEIEFYSPTASGLTLWLNDEPLGDCESEPGKWQTRQFDLKHDGRLLKLLILPKEPIIPGRQSGTSDTRLLGIAVSSIRLIQPSM